MSNKKKIIFYVTEDWYFYSHRMPLARAAVSQGMDVSVVTNVNNHGSLIESEGIKVIPLLGNRKSASPFAAIAEIIKFTKILYQEKPDILHNVAIRPVLFGSIAAMFTRQNNIINAITGLGWAYSATTLKAKLLGYIIRKSLKVLLSRSFNIVQNPDDYDWLVKLGVEKERISLIRGSGVDTNAFIPQTSPNTDDREFDTTIILVSRMIWEKGVGDLVNAIKQLQSEGVKTRCLIVGKPDLSNRSFVPEEQLKEWENAGLIEWLGHRTDIAAILRTADIACLPSYYREGVPKSLLEAASMGLPIITTDWPGCREVVQDKSNGFLVPVRDVKKLAQAIKALVVDQSMRESMGRRSREIAIHEFSETKVVSDTFRIYEKCS